MRPSLVPLLLPLLLLAPPACVDSPGNRVVDFEAVASGPADFIAGQPLSFDASRGWQVTLTTARLHVGALYFGQLPASEAGAWSCLLPDDYVAQVVEGREIDLLSNEPQAFPGLGRGSPLDASAGQVWLTGGDVNLADDPTPATVILRVSGSAERGSELRPFEASLTIAANRVNTSGDAAFTQAICDERIVSPIPTSIRVQQGGALWLRVDPRRLFTNVDFGALEAVGDVFVFKDDSSDQPSETLYRNLKAGDLYVFSWVAELP